MKRLAVIGSLLLLAACGRAHMLQPAKGDSLPPAPYGADSEPTGNQLITPSVQARPARGDELLTNSQDRRSDQFDLPPR
ncbi:MULTISPECIES: hypothetical protein [unclassified Sphingomonas]|uniref:hypothetical protein n=1 Tax=unclassified Sphingomonas TaxID=196159 RepID=UPI00092CD6A7|nr:MULTISPECIES: hypothetical protein [unclassified Sphingomonas]MBN8849582.1 hypothetical protein [Sphingomonas sp.]OJV31197.1 MAG: hypothetical protein BGO24_17670 [Sphingomonas sp. 67-36]